MHSRLCTQPTSNTQNAHPNHQPSTLGHATSECIPAYARSQPATPKMHTKTTSQELLVMPLLNAFPPMNAANRQHPKCTPKQPTRVHKHKNEGIARDIPSKCHPEAIPARLHKHKNEEIASEIAILCSISQHFVP